MLRLFLTPAVNQSEIVHLTRTSEESQGEADDSSITLNNPRYSWVKQNQHLMTFLYRPEYTIEPSMLLTFIC